MNTITHAANPYTTYTPSLSLCAVVVIAAIHACIFVLLTMMDIVPMPERVSTLMVDILRPELPVTKSPEPPKPPKPTPVEARPRRQTSPVPQQILAAQTHSPAAFSETTIVRDPPPPTLPDLPAPPAPATISQPRFAADYLSNPAPTYPPLSRRMGEEGEVVLRVHVETSGRPSQIEVRKSSGSPRLDQAALDAVWHWRFVPAKRGEEALAAWVLVPITFHLKN
ncbi:energy transducer TonB [Candidatus Accumulibacter phosphatis]|uniref:energy transducer TonB n=1 Tax=Candidatus Accumulibacter phosphatis TaxID=327160 RepID=UPI001FE83BBA|nr:energy transducer TonB [Candidatus Accumulibacter phosphatis]